MIKKIMKQLNSVGILVLLTALSIPLILIAAYIVNAISVYSIVIGDVSILVLAIGIYWFIDRIINEWESQH